MNKYIRDRKGNIKEFSVYNHNLNKLSKEDAKIHKFSMKNVMVMLIIFLVGSYSIIGIYAYFKVDRSIVLAEAKQTDIFKAKIEKLKDGIVTDLMKCEGQSYKESDALITYDPTKAMKNAEPTVKNLKKVLSFGLFQFKVGTVIFYEKMRSGSILDQQEAIKIALDTEKARDLAKYVGFETKAKFSSDWVNCSAKYKLDERVDLIHQME